MSWVNFFLNLFTFLLLLSALSVVWIPLFIYVGSFVFEHYVIVVCGFFLNIGLSFAIAYKKFTWPRWLVGVILLVGAVIFSVLARDGNRFLEQYSFYISFFSGGLCTASANIFFGMLKEHSDKAVNKNSEQNKPTGS